MSSGMASGSTFPLGVHTIEFTATDDSSLTATCSFTITVLGVAPDISCPIDMIVNNDDGECEAAVSFNATETAGIPVSSITYSQDPGTDFPVGTTTVTATATNSVSSDDCTFTVTVIDNEVPEAICPTSAITVTLASDGNGTLAANALAGGQSSDNCLSLIHISEPTRPY